MPNPSAQEQLTLEYINRLRLDPQSEYANLTDPAVYSEIQSAVNYFGVSLPALQSQLSAYSAVAPLAFNDALTAAARDHNVQMIAYDQQSHRLPGEASLADRVVAAGYTNWNALGENVFAFANSAFYGHAGFVIDWGYDAEDIENGSLRGDWQTRGDGMQDPPGHRNALLSATYKEIGIAITPESNSSTQVGPLVMTQDLGSRFNYQAQFLGVVIDDADNDDFYDIGEGLGGVIVTLTGSAGVFTTTTWAAGGWQIGVPAGTYDIEFSGGSLTGTINVTGTLGNANVKIDVEADDAVSSGPMSIDGTAANDTLEGTGEDDIINGLAGDDVLNGLDGNDELNGGPGQDRLNGGRGADVMAGGDDSDVYIVDNVADSVIETVDGGLYDKIRTCYDATLPENVEILSLCAEARFGTGNEGNNVLVGSRSDNVLSGLSGDDYLYGVLGSDELYGGAGNDWLDGGAGMDRMEGGSGNDTYVIDDVGDVIVEMVGGGTSDSVQSFIDYTLGSNLENLTLKGAATSGTGNALANLIYGSANADILSALGGDDGLFGGGGNDQLFGGDGNDRLEGGQGVDTMSGGDGDDIYFVENAADVVIEYADGGFDVLQSYVDFSLPDNVEVLVLRGFARVGSGNETDNRVTGSTGSDTLAGLGGNDLLFGLSGGDLMDGGAGNDRLYGDTGIDILTGGSGADVFHFGALNHTTASATTADTITDFNTLEGDRIHLAAIDANTTIAGDDAFAFIGNAGFTAAGQLRYENVAGETRIMGDVDGNGSADFVIVLEGTMTLVENNFVL